MASPLGIRTRTRTLDKGKQEAGCPKLSSPQRRDNIEQTAPGSWAPLAQPASRQHVELQPPRSTARVGRLALPASPWIAPDFDSWPVDAAIIHVYKRPASAPSRETHSGAFCSVFCCCWCRLQTFNIEHTTSATVHHRHPPPSSLPPPTQHPLPRRLCPAIVSAQRPSPVRELGHKFFSLPLLQTRFGLLWSWAVAKKQSPLFFFFCPSTSLLLRKPNPVASRRQSTWAHWHKH